MARNAKFQPMYPLLEGVTVRRFGHSNKVLMNGRSKGGGGGGGGGKTVTFSFFKNAVTIVEV